MDTVHNKDYVSLQDDGSSCLPCDNDVLFLTQVRLFLGGVHNQDLGYLDELFKKTSFPQTFNRFGVVIYQPDAKRILVVRRAIGCWSRVSQVVNLIKQHPRCHEFNFMDIALCRIQLEFILKAPRPIDIDTVLKTSNDEERFEIGINGLWITKSKLSSVHYFLPGDAFVRSIYTESQLSHYLKCLLQTEKLDDYVFQTFQSQSYISYNDSWVRLYRGYPVIDTLSVSDVERTIDCAVKNVVRHQKKDGRFLYYYCSAQDSKKDHEHPNCHPQKNPYYNILRHAGGAITLLFYYRMCKEKHLLVHINRAINYLIAQIVVYNASEGKQAGYVCYNKKGKLGGQGIALYLLSEYQHITGDDYFAGHALLLKNHILSQITITGEFLYYNIYLDKSVDLERNSQYFSFYYPGEAIIGLVCYYKYIELDQNEKRNILGKVKKALQFLFVDRKERYAHHYQSLPSDAWLMMAVNELWSIPEMRLPLYKENIFADADAMVAHMYTVEDGLYEDYPGSFYYQYGDHPYPDAARCEGLLAAYFLAQRCGDKVRMEKYSDALRLAAWAVYHLVNTPESIYSAKNPQFTIGGIRFKLTRQWFRIDTIQHVVCFYIKLKAGYLKEHNKEIITVKGENANLDSIRSVNSSTLSVSMIVKNEEQHLARALQHAKLFADEIIVIDTGSTDGTKKIAQQAGALCFDFTWCDDFSKARNFSASQCTKDFIMWLDADDVIFKEDAKKIRNILNSRVKWDVLYLPYYYHSPSKDCIAGLRKMPPRIWRNNLGIKWIYPIHEILRYPGPLKKKRNVTDIAIFHHPLGNKEEKASRYLDILLKTSRLPEYQNTDYFFWHIAKEYSALGKQNKSIYYFEKALSKVGVRNNIVKSRQYIGLGRQYRRLKQYYQALVAFGRAALAYPYWREPYFAMAQCLSKLGLDRQAATWIRVAARIPKPAGHIERFEIYDYGFFNSYLKRANLQVNLSLTEDVYRERRSEAQSSKKITLIAGGDVMLGRQMPDYIKQRGIHYPFESVASIFSNADLAMVNLECVMAVAGSFQKKNGFRPFYYRGRPEDIDVLTEVGINVVTTANNHSMDYGPQALLEQQQLLDSCGLCAPGSGKHLEEAAKPGYIEVDGLTIAVISIDTEAPELAATPESPGVFHAEESDDILKKLAAPLAEAERVADIIVISPHWGRNWKENASSDRVLLARAMIDLGADVILGHSSHILHGVEIYRGKPIIYDMGTLLFDRVSQSRMALSALFELEFTKLGFHRLKIHPVKLKRGKVDLANKNEAIEIRALIKKLSVELGLVEDFHRDGEALVLDFFAWDLPREKQASPEKVMLFDGIKSVPKSYNKASTDIVLSSYPKWKNIAEQKSIQFLGYDCSSSVKPGYGFVHKVLLRASGSLCGRWEACLSFLDHDGMGDFKWIHPIAEGAWPVANWEQGQLIVDETIVRPPVDLEMGVYKLFWQLINRDTQEAKSLEILPTREVKEKVYVGSIEITSSAISGVSGIC